LMKDEEHRLLADEVKMLRQEANRLQFFWENQFNDWVKEKNTLNNEIRALRQSLSSVEDYYKESNEVRE
jgi:chromosome segregation ATPase